MVNKIELSSLLLKKQALILHASYIINQEKAILFTAPSGTGKSTQARLWNKVFDASIINGDRAILRLKDSQLYAFGLPFSGSSDICKNESAPIRAIVILEQAEENRVERLPLAGSMKFLYTQTAVIRWKKYDVEKAWEIWNIFLKAVPIVKLFCLPDTDAVYVLDEYLKKIELGDYK